MNTTYEDKIKYLATTDKTELERGDVIIKDMARLMQDLTDYRYAKEHYNGTGDVLKDKIMSIKNSIAVMMGDMDIYMEVVNITDMVKAKNNKRIDTIYNRISNQ